MGCRPAECRYVVVLAQCVEDRFHWSNTAVYNELLMMNTVTVDGELCVLQSDISMLLKSALSIGPHMRSIGSFQNVALPGDEGAKLPYISLRCLLRTY